MKLSRMANKQRYVNADEAFEIATEFAGQADTKSAYAAFWKVAKAIQKMPAVEMAHGQWIKVADLCGIEVLKCSVCGKEHPRLPTAFCCDCGAKMDKGSESIG